MQQDPAAAPLKSRYPFVSVVVPAYNEHTTIVGCIESLLAQEYPAERREIIIVDNNSTDDTAEIIQKYPVTLLYEREIQTSYAARNRGVRHASGEIVAFTDADCMPKPNWLSRMVAPFDTPDVVGVAGVTSPIITSGLISQFMVESNPVRSHETEGLWYVATANVAFRRQTLLDVGLFRPYLKTGGDVDLGFRVQLANAGRIVLAEEAVVQHPFANTWEELGERFRRYGYSEILLDAMYGDQDYYMRSPKKQYVIMLHQLLALITYVLSFIYRAGRSIFVGWNFQYVAWPLLWFVAEGNNLFGKIKGLISTRFFTRKPAIRSGGQ